MTGRHSGSICHFMSFKSFLILETLNTGNPVAGIKNKLTADLQGKKLNQ